MTRKQPPLEVSAELGRKMLDGTITERQFRATIKEQAQYAGWQVLLEIPDRAYQVLARAAEDDKSLIPTLLALRAWPDLTLGHPARHQCVFVELKTVDGKLSKEQAIKLPLMKDCGMPVTVWRPGMAQIRRVLEGDDE
jgi:hypothetical protein